jgi:hypothetical protein
MGPFINTQTNDYPLYSGDLLLLGITMEELPDHICEVSVNPPEINYLEETYFENAPVLNENGNWEATFEIRPLTEDEKKINKIIIIKRKVMTDQLLTPEEALLLTAE